MLSTTCAVFNAIMDSDNGSSKEDKVGNIIGDDYGSFVTCCKACINKNEITNISLVISKSNTEVKSLYVVEKK